ncbi:MAG: 2-C-methyl-D-erythritol 4-phosphate cytidylyltransferase [Bacteroidota bacterium]
MKKFAILVAGGVGTRMQSATPKQFLLLRGEPVIVHTIRAFFNYAADLTMVIVLPREHQDPGHDIVREYFDTQKTQIKFCVGGASRFQSVLNGLKEIPEDGLVAIHDAVRPMITPVEIASTFDLAERFGSGVLVTQVKESLRKIKGQRSEAVDRSLYRSVQTPQTFSVALLKDAYLQEEIPEFTDDASVFEKAGHTVQLASGSYRNIKITTPEDLLAAEVMLSRSG